MTGFAFFLWRSWADGWEVWAVAELRFNMNCTVCFTFFLKKKFFLHDEIKLVRI